MKYPTSLNKKLLTGNKRFYSKPLFQKVLIANRGEIACRVMETCKKLGIRTVAVYSDADKNSRFVQMADEAYRIGKAEVNQSYLKYERILDVCEKTGAQAVHPGYGFLSENSEFYRACEKAGVKFIGPPEFAITSMGDKKASKEIMEKANVATVPGYHGEDQSTDLLLEESKKMGFPVLIKAVMGGGGKGMRMVEKEEDFLSLLKDAKNEALASFGDDRVLVEKFITRPRHIEIQVFGDSHDNYVYLFERDCSVQRRMQKIIEEAPAPGLPEELRKEMGESAVNAARAVNYEGAGTVEFIMDLDTNKYYFMEMNTRLQVEHPVTEMVTDTDLVEWQLQVASGNQLPKSQDELECKGHSFEARIYAEKPAMDGDDFSFLPATGTLHYLATPEEQDKVVRVDTGVREGDEVSIFYDPMIAKLIVHGPNRDIALKKLKYCLDEYQISGLPTNIEFLKTLATHPEFVSANLDCNFIPNYKDELFVESQVQYGKALASVAVWQQALEQGLTSDPFTTVGTARVNFQGKKTVQFADDSSVEIQLDNNSLNNAVVQDGEDSYQITDISLDGRALRCTINGHQVTCKVFVGDNSVHVFSDDGSQIFDLFQEKVGSGADLSEGALTSPMPGQIVEVHATVGQRVEKGDSLLVLLAMKMQNTITAPQSGVVKRIVAVDDLVGSDQVLCEIEEDEEE